MKRLLLVLPVLVLAAGTQQGITWLKLDQAKALSARTGNPILVYIACDPYSGSVICGRSPADKAFAEPCVLKRQENFHFARVIEKKTAQDLKATQCPGVIFMDMDGDEITRSPFQDAVTLDRAMEEAHEKYGPREISWSSLESKKSLVSEDTGRLLLLAFVDEKKESAEELKTLEDRTIAKLHDRVRFFRASYRREAEESKKYAVAQAPTLVALDPVRGEVVDRLAGKRTAKELKTFLQKALLKLEGPKK